MRRDGPAPRSGLVECHTTAASRPPVPEPCGLVLSLWKVDDRATALLMARLYQNLLGRRPGLSRPMPMAEALDEAKRWLRELTADQVGTELAALDRGTVRPLAKVDGPAPPEASSSPQPAGVRPYAHPYYWASFILIGDPR